ncbi:MAG: aspartate/glutamate racemase family protein [Hyphomicrobiaceae bacterium]
MQKQILVVNPNSNQAVTDGLSSALEPLRFSGGPHIKCTTLSAGPFGIESQADADAVTIPLRHLVEGDNESAAFVLACYSDPGLHVCREGTARPVFGIAECGILTALTRGESVGVLAIAQKSIRRHLRYVRQMGVMNRIAGERPLNMTVADTTSAEQSLRKMIEVGQELRDHDGADVIVMGCAGMARHREPLEDALDIPVVDPTLAAVSMAIGAIAVS